MPIKLTVTEGGSMIEMDEIESPEWEMSKEKFIEIWTAINKIQNRLDAVDMITSKEATSLIKLSSFGKDEFDVYLKSGAGGHLLKDEIRALRIIQNYAEMCDTIQVPKFDAKGRRRYGGGKCTEIKFVRTGSPRLKNKLGNLGGGEVHSNLIKRALQKVEDIDPSYYVVKNRLINRNPLTKFEVFIGEKKTETLLLKKSEHLDEKYPYLFQST
tara:strand:+ start:4268 stop:4906 length:639 start_codon:yes stop_codon:yes gene_type:complete